MTQRIDDGHSTRLSFAADSTVKFYEKTVTPPGIDAGGPIDTTTMHNTTYRTKSPKALLDITNAALTVAYDPATYPEILALAGVNNLITVTFPDGDTVAFWGWLDKFTPGELVEGEQGTADIEIVVSNVNGSNVETAPVYTAAA